MIRVNQFKGLLPSVHPRNLPNEYATLATNCEFKGGTLKGHYELDPVAATLVNNTKSIYLYENNFWFSWPDEVSVVKSPIAQDDYRRVYFTLDDDEEERPQVTSNLIATVSAPYPSNSYDLGIQQPDPVEIAAINQPPGYDPEDFSDDETRFYTMTYATEYGEEGPAAFASVAVELFGPGGSVELTLPIPLTNTENITTKRISRTSGDTGEFFFVAEVPLAAASFVDDLASAELGDVISTVSYFKPPDELRGLTVMANGIVAGFVKNELYFSESFLPYAYPPEYTRATEYDIVATTSLQTSLIVVTEGNPYVFSGVSPDSISEQKIALNQACVSSRSLVNIGNAVIYASPDGLVAITTGDARVITEKMITKRDWQQYEPSTIHAYFYENQYIGFYGESAGFIYDVQTNAFVDLDFYAQAGYSDLKTDTLYLVIDDELFAWDSGAAALEYVWRSKKFNAGIRSYKYCRVRGENLSQTKFKVWADNNLILNLQSIPEGPFRFPKIKATDWQFELSGQYEVTEVLFTESMAEMRQL